MKTLVYLNINILIFAYCSCGGVNFENPADNRTSAYLENQLFLFLLRNSASSNSSPTVTAPSSTSSSTSSISLVIGTPNKGFTVKNGGTDTVSIKLSSPPASTVTIPVTTSATTQGIATPSTLTFTSANWDQNQIVTVTGQDDSVYGVNSSFRITFGPTSSSDSIANQLSAQSDLITNRDYRKMLFVSNSMTDGIMGGISGADIKCNADSAKPSGSSSYKAMLVDGVSRIASVTANIGDGQVDWVLSPNTTYIKTNGSTIFISNAAGIFIFGTMNQSIGAGELVWTGLNANWQTYAAGQCSNWTSTAGTANRGNAGNTDSGTISNALQACNVASYRLYCVQQ